MDLPMKFIPSPRLLPALPFSNHIVRILNTLLACVLMFLTGSLYALGIFTVPIETQVSPPAALHGVWTSTIGFISLLSAPVSVVAGFFLDAGATPTPSSSFGNCKTHRVRILCLVISLSFACLSFVAYGVETANKTMVQLFGSLLAFPLGIIYLLANELLMVWNPTRPGLTTALGQLALSSGSILISSFYNGLISSFGCVQTFYIVSIIFCLVASLPMFLLTWPDSNQQLQHQQQSPCFVPVQNTELLATENVRLPWKRLNRVTSFWSILFVVFTCAVPYALLAFFFKLGHVFQIPSSDILDYFQRSTVLSSCFSVVLIFLTDFARFGSSRFSSGAKNVLTVMLLLQTILFALLIPFSMASNFLLFVTAVTILLVMMTSYSGCAAILVRDMFGPANTMVVFGIGAGVGQGSGEGLSTELMNIVESVQTRGGNFSLHPTSYSYFYGIAALWSFMGLMALICTRRCEDAFQSLPTTASYSSISSSSSCASKLRDSP